MHLALCAAPPFLETCRKPLPGGWEPRLLRQRGWVPSRHRTPAPRFPPRREMGHASVSSVRATAARKCPPHSPPSPGPHPGPGPGPTYQDAVERRRGPSPLHVAQHSHTCVETQPLDNQLLVGRESGGPWVQCPPHGPPTLVLAPPHPQGCWGVSSPGVPAEPAQDSGPQ